jgi:hypothetical protein
MFNELLTAFIIVAICVVIHTTALVLIGESLIALRATLEMRKGLFRDTIHLIGVFTFILILHLIETAIWAIFYLRLSLFADFETSLYFSIVSYATIGYGDVVLPKGWRLLAGIEGISGVLLCGLSTAFVFVLINAILEIRRQQSSKSNDRM